MTKRDVKVENSPEWVGALAYLKEHARPNGEPNDKLFEEYRKTKSRKVLAQIFDNNISLVALEMGRFTKMTGETGEEYVSVASMALMRAIELFDADKGFCFSTYAIKAMERQLFAELKGQNSKNNKFYKQMRRIDEMIVTDNSSLSDVEDGCDLLSLLSDSDGSPEDIVMSEYSEQVVARGLKELFGGLSEKQKSVVKEWLNFEGGNGFQVEVAKQNGVSRQAVQNALKLGVLHMAQKTRGSEFGENLKDCYHIYTNYHDRAK